MTITYQSMGEELVSVLPQLRPGYEQLLEWWGDEEPGSHIVFGDLLNPLLLEALNDPVENREILEQAFVFLEELAGHPDEQVQEVVAVTVCERIGTDIQALKVAHSYMGPKTRKLSDDIEAFWGRPPTN